MGKITAAVLKRIQEGKAIIEKNRETGKDEQRRVLDDGDNLYVVIPKVGRPFWRYFFRYEGAASSLSLGAVAKVSAVDARRMAANYNALKGKSPAEAHKETKNKATKKVRVRGESKEAATVAERFAAWLPIRIGDLSKSAANREERYAGMFVKGFRKPLIPGMGAMPINTEPKAFRVAMSRIVKAAPSSDRLRMIRSMHNMLAASVAEGHLDNSPIAGADFKASVVKHKRKGFAAITDEEPFGQLLRDCEAHEARADHRGTIPLAFRLHTLTAVRPGTTMAARWAHFHGWQKGSSEAATWNIPFEELKMARLREENDDNSDFVVPLSRQAVEVLRELHELSGDTPFLFPGRRGTKSFDKGSLNVALVAMGYGSDGEKGKHVGHGFRKAFRTIMNRQKDKDGRRLIERQVLELCLDHRKTGLEADYDHDNEIEDRRKAMQSWADAVDEMRAGKANRKPTLKVVA